MKPHMYLLNKDWEPTIVYLDEMKEGREKDYKTLTDYRDWRTRRRRKDWKIIKWPNYEAPNLLPIIKKYHDLQNC